jgi:hypothetical protein
LEREGENVVEGMEGMKEEEDAEAEGEKKERL